MNPANIPNVGGAMPAVARPHGQVQGPLKNENTHMIMAHIAQILQNQPPFTGWRSEVSVKDRAVKVYQLMTSLRLIQPQIGLQSAAQFAMSFEHKAFKEAREKADYEKEYTDKIIQIRDTRVRQAAVMQGGMMPQGAPPAAGMPGMGQNQGQTPFQQMNRPVQASPLQDQQPMPAVIAEPNHQQQQQSQPQQQTAQNIMQQSRQPPRPANGLALPDDFNSLSPQEYEHVCRLANQMLANTSPEHMERIKMNLQDMSPEQRQYLSRKNLEPITYFFRVQALDRLRRHKRTRREMARAQNVGVDPNGAMMGDPMMNPQQRQMVQNMMSLQRNSAFPVGGQQNFDPSFMGNVENIQGQQADGLRSQEAGQLVVPASSSQMNQQPFPNPQGVFQVGQPLPQNGQPNITGASMSPQFLTQQHLPNAAGVQPDRAQLQAQSQAHARMEAAQKAQMAMSSQAGQTNPQLASQIPPQSPAMSMLNRPMSSAQISPAQSHVRPPSRPPAMPQQPINVQSFAGQPTLPGRPQIPPGLPPALQEHLAQLNPDQLKAFLMTQHQRALANQRGMQQNVSVAGQGQQTGSGQMSNNQNLMAAMGLQQPIPGIGGPQAQNQMLQGGQQQQRQQPAPQLTLQQQQAQQRHDDFYKLQLLRQSGFEMTPDQVREMDQLPFPPAILNMNPNMSPPIPKNITTWGQLKHWATANPQVLDLSKLIALQTRHLAQRLAQGKDGGNRNPGQNGQGNGIPMFPFQGPARPFMNPSNLPSGQQPHPMNLLSMRPITPQEIQILRQRLGPQSQNYNDDQLRKILQRSPLRIMQARVARESAAQNMASQGQHALQAQQSQIPTQAQNTSQSKQQSTPQPPTSRPGQQSPSIQVPAPAKGTKATSTGKQAPKKRPRSDEPADAPNPAIQTTTQPLVQPNITSTAPARPNAPPTRGDQMLPKRGPLDAQVRKQQRGPISRALAEETWSHLPEKIKQLYGDIQKNVPAADPISVSPEQKAAMAQQLRECTDMLARMDTLVQWFVRFPNQERTVRSLLTIRVQLMRQFKPTPEWALNEDFTISPEYLLGIINYVKRLFRNMIDRVHQHQNQPSAQRPSVSQGAVALQQTGSANPSALNAQNLQQLQQEEEALQQARRASSQAGSVSSAIPPAPFGAPSPSGVPHAYGPGGFTPEKLKIPPNKKRKQSHPATPAQAQGPGISASKPQAPKQQAVQAKPTAPIVGGPFKCGVVECQHHYHGFPTQTLLDKHVQENHKTEEPIENALDFALESFRTSLVKDNEKVESPELKKTPTATADIQQGLNKPATTMPLMKDGTTPMVRGPSQLGPKLTPPASNQQLTPRQSAGKALTPSALKPTMSKDGKKEAGKPGEQEPSAEDVVMKDSWADSAVSLDAIHDAFTDFRDDGLQGLGFDPMDEFLNPEMFVNAQSKDTPDSVDSTGMATRTPRDTQASKGDVDVKIEGVSDDSWVPADWVNVPSRFEGGLMSNSWDDIDWESMDRKDGDITFDDGGIPVFAV